MPEAKNGFVIGWMGLNLLPKMVGINAAKEILLMAKPFGAKKAKICGLVDEILPKEQFIRYALNFSKNYFRRDQVLTQ